VSLFHEEFDVSSPTTYSGALFPQQVITKLLQSGFSLQFSIRMNNILWKADLRSIPTLRWLLPIVSELNQLILVSQ
jgi:hypothetical protein